MSSDATTPAATTAPRPSADEVASARARRRELEAQLDAALDASVRDVPTSATAVAIEPAARDADDDSDVATPATALAAAAAANPQWRGSIADYLLRVVQPEVERVDGGALFKRDLEEWKRWHSDMEQRHVPVSAMAPRMFRALLMGALPGDANFFRLLLVRRLVELNKLTQKQADELVAAHQAITYMYPSMRANVERKRAAAGGAITTK